jgi:hypothetical protein
MELLKLHGYPLSERLPGTARRLFSLSHSPGFWRGIGVYVFISFGSERQEVFQAGLNTAFPGLVASEEDRRLLRVTSLFQGMAWIGMTYVYVPRLHIGEASRFFLIYS